MSIHLLKIIAEKCRNHAVHGKYALQFAAGLRNILSIRIFIKRTMKNYNTGFY